MLKLKTPLIIAGAMCVFSMLIGMISGVRFWNILIRGLVAGIGAGGFAFLARFLLERFVPDLFTSQSSPHTAEPTDAAFGSNVNITLDDDLDTDSAQGTSGLSDTGNASSEATDHNHDNVIEENADSEPSNSGSAVDNDKDDFSAPSGSAFSATGQEEQSTLSDLPGMGNFLEDDEASQEDITSDEAASNSSFSVNGIETGGNDSKVMAQAIRTILATED